MPPRTSACKTAVCCCLFAAQVLHAGAGRAQSAESDVARPGAGAGQAQSVDDYPARAAPSPSAPAPGVGDAQGAQTEPQAPVSPLEETPALERPAASPTPPPAEEQANTNAPLEQARPQASERLAEPVLSVTPPKGSPPGKTKKKKETKLKLGARIYAGWEYDRERPRGTQTGDSDTDQRFLLRQARLSLTGTHQDWLSLRLSGEFADALDPAFRSTSTRGEDIDYLRTAYVNLRAREELQLRVGRFRRPFSGLELTSSFDLPIRSRGLTNNFIVEAGDSSLYWGDRAVGAMLWGRSEDKKLRWAISVSNPRLEEQGVMGHVRLEYRPLRWLRLAGNAAARRADNLSGERMTAVAAGGDVRIRHAGLEILVDAIAGQNVDSIASDKPFAAGILGYASYDLKVHAGLTLRPVVALEWLDRTLDTAQSEAGRAVVGVNWVLDKRFRVLSEVDVRRPLGDVTNLNPVLARERYSLLALTEF